MRAAVAARGGGDRRGAPLQRRWACSAQKEKVGAPKRAEATGRPTRGGFAVGGARRTADERWWRPPPAQWLRVGAHRLRAHRVLGALRAAAGPPPAVALVASLWPVSRVMVRQRMCCWVRHSKLHSSENKLQLFFP